MTVVPTVPVLYWPLSVWCSGDRSACGPWCLLVFLQGACSGDHSA